MRQVFRYLGGKTRIAPWIISHFPKHECYGEPFGGSASVLMAKPQSPVEAYNELNGECVNYFRVLRNPELAAELKRLLELTPFAQEEYNASFEPSDDPVEQARRTFIKGFIGMGAKNIAHSAKHGYVLKPKLGGGLADGLASYPKHIKVFTNRLRNVNISQMDALKFMRTLDGENTLLYVDPPYIGTTEYKIKFTIEQQTEMLDWMLNAKSMIVLSGYENDLYKDKLQGWTTDTRQNNVDPRDGKQENLYRTEWLWMNPACVARQAQQRLF